MLIELVAKLLLDATAGGDHRLPGPEGCQATDQDCAHHRQGNRTDQVDADPRLQFLNGQTHQTGHCHLGETRQQDEDDADGKDRPLLTDQRGQKPESTKRKQALS